MTGEGPLYLQVARLAQGWAGPDRLGLVVGATDVEALAAVREADPLTPAAGPRAGGRRGGAGRPHRSARTACMLPPGWGSPRGGCEKRPAACARRSTRCEEDQARCAGGVQGFRRNLLAPARSHHFTGKLALLATPEAAAFASASSL
jgi:hypothetical protein